MSSKHIPHYLPTKPQKHTDVQFEINLFISKSLRKDRDLPGIISDLKRLGRMASLDEKDYYKKAIKNAKDQLKFLYRAY